MMPLRDGSHPADGRRGAAVSVGSLATATTVELKHRHERARDEIVK